MDQPGAVDSGSSAPGEHTPLVTWREAWGVWTRIALQSFGGPAGQIAVMHRILVEERRWVSEARFLHALNYCMLLPGPEAQQLATYIGWLLQRTPGALLAGGLFVLPGCLALFALSAVYVSYGNSSLVAGLFFGLKAAVLAIVVQAVVRIGRRALVGPFARALAAAAFLAVCFGGVPFPWVVAGAALAGVLGHRFGLLAPAAGHASAQRGHTPAGVAPHHDDRRFASDDDGADDSVAARLDAHPPAHTRPSLPYALRVAGVCGALWGLPLFAVAQLLGPNHALSQIGAFFSRAALVTFGGAYAVLTYVAQQAVETYHWLQPGEMLDGLGMAETTPGPLIMVVQFVGFLGAYRQPGTLDPWLAATLGGLLATWVTFVPCFLWILVGAPWVEALRGQRALSAALSGITAAVVGVILNLAVWFALHTLFAVVHERHPAGLRLLVPEWATLDVAALALTVLALLATFRWRLGMLVVLGGAALAGALWTLSGAAA